VVVEERTRPGHWLGSMLSVSFSALTLTAEEQEGHLARKNPIPLIVKGSLP